MNITETLNREELARLLVASGLWESSEAVEDALAYRYNFDVIARDEGETIEEAIGRYYLDDLGFIDRQPRSQRAHVDRENFGREVRLIDTRGRVVYEPGDPAGRYYVRRWNWNR